MWKFVSVLVVTCLAFTGIKAQDRDVPRAVMMVCGESELEDLDTDRVEHFSELMRHPVRINSLTRTQLEATGLFTPYQLASLSDYLLRHGNVCSESELACIDGFSPGLVKILSPFLDLDCGAASRKGSPKYSQAELAFRGGYKSRTDRDERKSMYGFKSRLSFSDKVQLSLAASDAYDSAKPYPTLYSANVVVHHRTGKVIVGGFNARFGEGLCMWNTASVSSLTTPSGFMKRPSGLSATNSFTGSSAKTGIATDFMTGRWKISALVSLPGVRNILTQAEKLMLSPAVNLTRFGRYGHISVTHDMAFSNFTSDSYRIPSMASSVDASACIDGVNIFCESAYDWVRNRPSTLAGCEFSVAGNVCLAAQMRYLPLSNEHAAAFASEFHCKKHRITLSTEGLYHPESKSKDGKESFQVKGQADWIWNPVTRFEVRVKLSERFRTWGLVSVTKIRTDVRYAQQAWNATLRLDAVHGSAFAFSGYAEAGYTGKAITVYGRYGMFMVDSWEDRIYVYERDAPGNFNVPALYGRGFWASMYISWKFTGWGKLYLSAAYKKPGNAELKLQTVLQF